MTTSAFFHADEAQDADRSERPAGDIRGLRAEDRPVIGMVMRLQSSAVFDGPGTLHLLIWERANQGLGAFLVFSTRPAGICSRNNSSPLCIHALWVASYLPREAIARQLLDAATAYRLSDTTLSMTGAGAYAAWDAVDVAATPLAVLAVIA